MCARVLADQRQPLAGGNEPGTGSVVAPGHSCLVCWCHLHARRERWFNAEKGYGFISRAGQDVFVHYSEIDGYGFRGPEENQHVEFEVTQGPKGLQATHVRAA
jgi:cold shock protein